MGRFLDPRQPVKRLWQNLESVGVKESTDNSIMSTSDQFNDFIAAASPRSSTSSITPLTTAFPGRTTTAFNGTFDLEVFNAIIQYTK
jgi:hypothetical protein